MSEGHKETPQGKQGLVPTTGLYCIIALALILTIGLVITSSLVEISDLATSTRDKVLPAILDRQRTAVNLERLSRFAEIVYRSEDPAIRRQYKLAARILSHESIFEEDPALNAKVIAAYRGIERIAELRAEHLLLKEHRESIIFRFMPGTDNAEALVKIPEGRALASLLVKADRTGSLGELNTLGLEFSKVTQTIATPSARLQKALDDAALLFESHKDVLNSALAAEALWLKVNESLDTISSNLSAKAAVTADESFTFISDEAKKAVYTTLLAAAALMLSLLILLYFAQRNIVAPIIRSIQGLDRIGMGERDVKLPEARLRELDDIRLAVERSSVLLAEHADRTLEMEDANRALEIEINHRQKTQELLAEAKERAETADRAKSDFLAGMSHEIRTPMNTMIGMSDLLLETNPTPKQREYIGTLKLSGNMLLGIINDVLDLSKIEEGEVELEVVDINRDKFLSRTRQIVAGRAEQKGVDFIIDVDDDVPTFFRGDPTRLRQVLVNLIDNGVKFTESGEVRLAIQRSDNGDQPALTFAIIDTGIGIPQDAQDHIFQRFTQADTSTTREYGGTGLGLPICQKLVELMGGSIQLESTPGQGAVFHFTLPLESCTKPTPQPKPKQDAPKSQIERLNSCPLSILVAEDSESNRALIDLYFKKTACRLQFATDGNEAIEMFKKNRYDLVLMDIQMPGMDGYEATRHIRAMEVERGHPPIPILAVTANAFKEDQERSEAAGCTDYLAKPVSKTTILKRVAYHALSDGETDA